MSYPLPGVPRDVTHVPSHHLVYGKCSDYLTGKQLADTDDERCRQDLARLLVESLGYDKQEILPRLGIITSFAGRRVVSVIDFTLSLEDRVFMIIRYAPGSMVSRERPAIAAARVLVPDYRVPLAVVTNVHDAELIDSSDGRVLATGLASIPARETALRMTKKFVFLPRLDDRKHQRELRILNAFDDEGCCEGNSCSLSDRQSP